MTCQELATAVRHEIPVKVFLMNNGYFGMVRQWQELFWDGRYSSVEMGPSPDWSKLAEAFGMRGMMVDDKNEVEAPCARRSPPRALSSSTAASPRRRTATR